MAVARGHGPARGLNREVWILGTVQECRRIQPRIVPFARVAAPVLAPLEHFHPPLQAEVAGAHTELGIAQAASLHPRWRGWIGDRVLRGGTGHPQERSEEHTSELQSLMRTSYAVFCLHKKPITHNNP